MDELPGVNVPRNDSLVKIAWPAKENDDQKWVVHLGGSVLDNKEWPHQYGPIFYYVISRKRTQLCPICYNPE